MKNTEKKTNSIADFLVEQGYQPAARTLNQDLIIFMKQSSLGIDLVTVVDMIKHPGITEDYIKKNIVGISARIEGAFKHTPRNLSLIIGERSSMALNICRNTENCWYLDAKDSKIYLYENQLSDFNGIRHPLENWISTKGIVFPRLENGTRTGSIAGLILVGITTVCYFLQLLGVLTVQELSLDINSLMMSGELYRLFTCMFLHNDFLHLLYNMLTLFLVSQYVERFYGSFPLTLGYFLSGVTGGMVSMYYSYHQGLLYSSLGASGAIYGLLGMALFYILTHRKNFDRSITYRLFMAAACLIVGSLGTNIDYMAHLGGFLGGIFFAFVVTIVNWLSKDYLKGLKEKLKMEEDDDED